MATVIDLHNAYDSEGVSVKDLFGSEGEGFYVPAYQREYTWEEDNINQLFEDLLQGVREFTGGDNFASTFLGTAILTNLSNKKTTADDPRAQPSGVRIVIDGQQRISTLALLSVQLMEKLRELSKELPNKGAYISLIHHCTDETEKLRNLYAVKIGKGSTPPLKPKIIRDDDDKWTFDGEDALYTSPVALYLATFIRTEKPDAALSALDAVTGTRVRGNISLINSWLDGISEAHVPNSRLHGQYPCGSDIVTDRMMENVLGFSDTKIRRAVAKKESQADQNDYAAAAIYQLFLLTFYLLTRCGVNRLQPSQEEWGFDMFQALNATGTPLTAMETFRPQVMQAEKAASQNWAKSQSRQYLDEINELFEATTTNEQKTQRTNELFGTFALCYDGEKLGNKFSAQRRWITNAYEKQTKTISEKRAFLKQLARVSNFYRDAWYMAEPQKPYHIVGLETHPQGEFASLLVQYLKDANSRLSAPVLARFYAQALDGTSSFNEFVEACKACAAFFTLWRPANSTSGLDDIYRKFFSGSSTTPKVPAHNHSAHPASLKASDLKAYFSAVLDEAKVRTKAQWIPASDRFLLYTELKTVCRFVLFVAQHDRTPDPAKPGLTVKGAKAVCPLLTLSRWSIRDHKSLEHVAPQRPPSGSSWDTQIYTENLVHTVGNLLLLPVDINKFVDNKEWTVKYLHYAHIGSRTQAEIDALNAQAKKAGINLSKKATAALGQASYSCAVEPVLTLKASGPWDAALIKARTFQIKELAWETMDAWLK